MQVRTMPYLALALALGASNVFAQAGGLPAEIAARIAAEQQLREQINETSVVGRYAVTGSQTCWNSNTGFNADFTPVFQPSVTTTLSTTSIFVRGFFAFQADGHGTSDIFATVVNLPGGFNSAGTGGVGVQHLGGTFDWMIEDGKLTVFNQVAPGVAVQGSGVGAAGDVLNVQPLSGYVGKDAKVITLSNDGLAVETVLRFVNGQTFSGDRICGRERVLTKMSD
ncbi:MAG TPA: hypothetical protein VE935_01380 [Burkholderiales bacterium]|nr:hypothetical protein [Burkholderiales bacterium]